MENNILIKCFEEASANMVKEFISKMFDDENIIKNYTTQGIKEMFVGNDITGVLEYNDIFINLGDIYIAMSHDITPTSFFEWYDYNVKWNEIDSSHYINLISWINGAPRRTTTEYLNAKLKHDNIFKLQNEFLDYIKSLTK